MFNICVLEVVTFQDATEIQFPSSPCDHVLELWKSAY